MCVRVRYVCGHACVFACTSMVVFVCVCLHI